MLKSVSLMQNSRFLQKGQNSIIGHGLSHEKIHLTKCSEMITTKEKIYFFFKPILHMTWFSNVCL